MSNKLIKEHGRIVLPNDRPVGTITIMESGRVHLDCGQIPAIALIKIMQASIMDIMCVAFQPNEEMRKIAEANGGVFNGARQQKQEQEGQ